MPGHVETEFKLRTAHSIEIAAVDAAVRESAFDCAEIASHRHNDIYLDDARGSLAAFGIGLRVRVHDGGSIVTCKSQAERSGAMFVRDEFEAPWPSSTTPPTAAELPSALRDAVEPILLRRPLVPVLRLDVTRDIRRLHYDDHELCELAVDHVRAHGAGRNVEFTEIELEVVDDLPSCEKLAEHLAESLQIQAASNDKPTHAARLLGLERQNGAERPDAAAKATTALHVTLQLQVQAVQRAEIAVRHRNDSAAVHGMRTSLRRLRSTVSAFPQLWTVEQHRWLSAHLRALAAELGRARDLDVMAEQLPQRIAALPDELQAGAERVADWLRDAQKQAHADLGVWLRSGQRLDDAQRFGDLIFEFAAARELVGAKIATVARDCLARHAKKLRRCTKALSGTAPIAAFHATRIAAKRLRYLHEELGSYLGSGGKLPKRLTRLQDALGELCDHDAAARQLLAWEPRIRARHAEEPDTIVALGALIQQRHGAATAGRQAAVEATDKLRRRLRLPS